MRFWFNDKLQLLTSGRRRGWFLKKIDFGGFYVTFLIEKFYPNETYLRGFYVKNPKDNRLFRIFMAPIILLVDLSLPQNHPSFVKYYVLSELHQYITNWYLPNSSLYILYQTLSHLVNLWFMNKISLISDIHKSFVDFHFYFPYPQFGEFNML